MFSSDICPSKPLSNDQILDIMEETNMIMTEERYDDIINYHLTCDFLIMREAYYNNSIEENGFHCEWYNEFYNYPTEDKSSYVERRLEYLSNPDNMIDSYTYNMIKDSISVASLMILDDIYDNSASWFYYSQLADEEQRLFYLIHPEIAKLEEENRIKEEEEKQKNMPCVIQDVIEYHSATNDIPKGVRKFNDIYQAMDCETGVWCKTHKEFGYKKNLFEWIKEQGNSEQLTEELESWRAKKPKLAPSRKRHQIVIKNIIKGVCERHLFILAQNIGITLDISFPINKVSGKQDKAFIEFKYPESVHKAIRLLHEMPLGRAIIYVDVPNN